MTRKEKLKEADQTLQRMVLAKELAPSSPPAPAAPMLDRDGNGSWTLSYSGPAQSLWQVWTRYEGSPDWSEFGEVQTSQFPASDDMMSPGGAWWQVKICGEGDDNSQTTPFSNVVSFGPAP